MSFHELPATEQALVIAQMATSGDPAQLQQAAQLMAQQTGGPPPSGLPSAPVPPSAASPGSPQTSPFDIGKALSGVQAPAAPAALLPPTGTAALPPGGGQFNPQILAAIAQLMGANQAPPPGAPPSALGRQILGG